MLVFRNSSLYFLENPYDPHSFACIATATAVLNIADPAGEMNANLEVSVNPHESFIILLLNSESQLWLVRNARRNSHNESLLK